jgi:uncharacterized repeat protein (TIGR04052 family)
MNNCKRAFLTTFFCLFYLSSCDNSGKLTRTSNKEITFQPAHNGETLNCDSVIPHSAKQWHYTQLQFFISAIELKNNQGVWQKATLLKSAFQTYNVALLGEQCSNINAKNNANWLLKFNDKTNLANITSIRFDLGLPFAINHLNPLTQESPLNIPTMFWGWQKGHKFLRLEMASSNNNWLFHLGSVGCKAASPLRAPKQECLYPNRYTFELPINKGHNQIQLELSALLSNITIAEQTSCQSSPDKTSCLTLFTNLTTKGENSVFQSIQKEINHD